MLTIHSPLKLRCQEHMETMPHDLEEKIRGNYSLMSAKLHREDLIHLTAATPEVYFAGGEVGILNQNVRVEQQEFRLDVINNLMNRVFLSHTDNFHYQDTVYVENILRKLGIHDVQGFLRQVQDILSERRENYWLAELYESSREQLRELFSAERETRAELRQEERQEAAETASAWHLHEAIYKRLSTSRIYQEVAAHSVGLTDNSRSIFRTEMRVAEQAALIQNFRLHEAKNELLQQEFPLAYYHANRYELIDDEAEERGDGQVAQMNAALLLNLVDEAYSLRLEKLEQDSHTWLSVAGALFETVENTWKRYEAYHKEGKMVNRSFFETVSQIREERRTEAGAVLELVKAIEEVPGLVAPGRDTWRETDTERELRRELRQDTVRELSGGFYRETAERLPLSHPEWEAGEDGTQPGEAAHTPEEIRSRLEEINKRNLENLQKVTEITRSMPGLQKRTVNRERAMRDARRALENPQEVLREYLSEERLSPEEAVKEQIGQEIYNLLSDETKAIYENVVNQKLGQAEIIYPEQPGQAAGEVEEAAGEPVKPGGGPHAAQMAEKMVRELMGEAGSLPWDILRQEDGDPAEGQAAHEPGELAELSTKLQRSLVAGAAGLPGRDGRAEVMSLHHPEPGVGEASGEPEWAGAQPREVYHHTEQLARETRTLREQVSRVQAVPAPVREQIRLLYRHDTERLYENLAGHTDTERRLVQDTLRDTLLETRAELRQEQAEVVELALREELPAEVPLPGMVIPEPAAQAFGSLPLVHKREEHGMDEEALQAILAQARAESHTEHTSHQAVTHSQVTETQVQEAVRNVTLRESENVDELISRTVQRQLGYISDQVYGRIEKRLQTERRRRGR